MVFYWGLSDNKSPRVSMTFFSILADLNNVVVWMVSTHSLISKSSSPFNNPSMTVPRVPIINCVNVTFIFHSVFQFLSNVLVFILLLNFFLFCSVFSRDSQVYNSANFIFGWILLDLIVSPSLDALLVCQNPIGVCVSFSGTAAGLCIYHLFAWSNFNFFHNSEWITLPIQSFLVLYTFSGYLLRLSLCDW